MSEPIPSATRLLGKGLALTPVADSDAGLDVAFDAKTGTRDLKVVTGHDALLQDLRVALCAGLGTDPLNRAFGSDAFAAMAEETEPVMLRERIRVAIIRVLRADPRVRRVVEVRIDGQARPFAATPQAGPGGRTTELGVVAVFETVMSDFATIQLEGLLNA